MLWPLGGGHNPAVPLRSVPTMKARIACEQRLRQSQSHRLPHARYEVAIPIPFESDVVITLAGTCRSPSHRAAQVSSDPLRCPPWTHGLPRVVAIPPYCSGQFQTYREVGPSNAPRYADRNPSVRSGQFRAA
jgi:hypothetical protein